MWIARIGTTLVLGLLGWAFPRVLVEAGVPLDRAVSALGLNFDRLLLGFAVIFALAMFWAEGRYQLM